MSADQAVLVFAWLVLAHLAADFVLQAEWMAVEKFGHGPRATRALLAHVAVVIACSSPLAAIFGLPGLAFVFLVGASHGLIDRAKIVLTRRAEARALAAARRAGLTASDMTSQAGPAAGAALERAWTPVPAFLFAADQLVHLVVLGLGWAWLLAGAAPLPWFAGAAGVLLGGWDQALVQRVSLVAAVVGGLLIVEVRAGSLFVATLVKPRAAATGTAMPPQPDRVGEAIGVLERLLITAFVLAHAEAAIGLVVAAKTLARFRQLDEREFAEYYLLGTLASVAVAFFSALLAGAALRSIGW